MGGGYPGRRGPGRAPWGSPVVVDDVLLQGDCGGVLHACDVRSTTVDPPDRWRPGLGGCGGPTPAGWRGSTHVGTRAGQVFAIDGA